MIPPTSFLITLPLLVSTIFFPLCLISVSLRFVPQTTPAFVSSAMEVGVYFITIWSLVIPTSGSCPYWCVCPKTWQVHWYAVGDTAFPYL